MTPVDQTTFGIPHGNCFSACVATLLDLPLVEVPWFMGDDWPEGFQQWLAPLGLYSVCLRVHLPDGSEWYPPGLHILGGQSPRGPHAVVALGRTIVHDPHPSRSGLLVREDCTMLVPCAPRVSRSELLAVNCHPY